MRHFEHLSDEVRHQLFLHPPGAFDQYSERELLATALGATLYIPATKAALAPTVRRQAAAGVRSMVLDLEDAIPDGSTESALSSTVETVRDLAADPPPALVFVRVRAPEQVGWLADQLGADLAAVSGFVLPKFSALRGVEYLDAVGQAAAHCPSPLYAMPVLETREVLYRETREAELLGIRGLLEAHRDRILSVRIGATDLCGLFGIRRDRDLSIYDVGVASELISHVVNLFGRADGTGFAITGPVWEYFADHERLLRPQLRYSPFEERSAAGLRTELLRGAVDGLIREAILDRANGLTGKSVIHPRHVAPITAFAVVSHEEFSDAQDVLRPESAGGGVTKSGYGDKMNEAKPHRNWAHRTLLRAEVFGVAAEGVSFVDLLTAHVQARPAAADAR
ncbi:ATP/GTP-binding protein [Nakamurella flava]|uniref:ATP/GTP-binding protein n=1 Tax=Nakamurella flava TaxID=2576308 RepID=A0A4U6QCM0_9ACTN|nr:HpcH/HpaI aldolase/citrate lyase family protein [Nakamurella flava]TKV57844.1 ATP/GTP-binding protein [Nakamurella flava]